MLWSMACLKQMLVYQIQKMQLVSQMKVQADLMKNSKGNQDPEEFLISKAKSQKAPLQVSSSTTTTKRKNSLKNSKKATFRD